MGTRLYVTLAFTNSEAFANLFNTTVEKIEEAERLIAEHRNQTYGSQEEAFYGYCKMVHDPVAEYLEGFLTDGLGKLTGYDYNAIDDMGLDKVSGVIENRDKAIVFLVGHLASKGRVLDQYNWEYLLSMLTAVSWN
ncbi:hypothetical protein DRO27_03670 [Candidatus Bathyarchaeota archaeon]|nr:MAG: hypothetical protein DRO27_03670 [Candidatus Bathyarchaeota archaeon]